MMKIVFPTLHVRRSAQAVPIAAGCLAAALPSALRNQTTFLDFFPEDSEQNILSAILAEQPDLVAFPVYVWNRRQVTNLAIRLHEQNPELVLVAGGPEVTGDPATIADTAFWSALVHGEGEESFARLVEALEADQPVENIAGISWEPTAESVASALTVHIEDLNPLPSPWLSGMLSPTPERGVLWEVARGCAFSCDYCFDARGHEGVRTIHEDRLVAELELFQQLGVTQVWVLDSTFNYPPERGIQLLELLIKHAPQIHYHFEAKSDYFDRHLASLLGQLHCSVQLGVQSMQKQVLKTIHRPLDIERLHECVHLLAGAGVTYGFDLIYGLPSDNYSGFRESLDSVLAFSPNHVHTFPLSVLPGTRLARHAAQHGLVAQDHPPYEIISSASWTAADLQKCRILAATLDIFYNTGRAVAFFPTLIHTLGTNATAFLEEFSQWMLEQPDIDLESLLDTDSWSAMDAYRLQQNYLTHRLQQCGKTHLVTAVLDLICYHYHYAETLLGEELPLASPTLLDNVNGWEMAWQRAGQLRLAPFAYEVYDLLEMEEMELEDFVELFRPVGSVAVFLRRGDEVFCESLSEDFQRLLKNSDGRQTPKDIFAGTLSRETGEELVAMAVGEGLLQPVAKTKPA